MKIRFTTVLLVSLGLVCSAYTAPIDVEEQIFTYLRPSSSIQDNEVKKQIDTHLRPVSIQDYNNDNAEAQVLPAALVLGSKFWQLVNKLKARKPSIQDDDDAEAQFGPLLMLGARAAPLLARAAPAAGRLAARVGPKALKYALKYGPDAIDVIGALRNGGDAETQDCENHDDAKAQSILPKLLLPLLLKNPFQEQAETEKVMGKLIEATSKYGPEFLQRALKYGPKMLSNRDNGETQDEGDDDDDDDYQIEALLQNLQDKADAQFLGMLKAFGG